MSDACHCGTIRLRVTASYCCTLILCLLRATSSVARALCHFTHRFAKLDAGLDHGSPLYARRVDSEEQDVNIKHKWVQGLFW